MRPDRHLLERRSLGRPDGYCPLRWIELPNYGAMYAVFTVVKNSAA